MTCDICHSDVVSKEAIKELNDRPVVQVAQIWFISITILLKTIVIGNESEAFLQTRQY